MSKALSGRERPDRERLAVLTSGLFTNGVWDMLSVVVPLYAVAIGLNAAEIGIIVAARSILPTVLSIHGGILTDQLGTRRVLLWVAIASTALPLIYPIAGWFFALVALQLLLGLASSVAMAASQTWVMLTNSGDTQALVRYSVATRIGTFFGPIVVGAAWDAFGSWVAFVSIALCGAGTIAALALCAPSRAERAAMRIKPSVDVLLPRWEPHKQALMLAAIPAVAFILCASFLRNSTGGIQSSLYVVYLNGIGQSGTIIGVLVAIAEISGVLGSLAAARMEKRVGTHKLVIGCIAVSLISITSTPLIGQFITLLIAANVLRGIAQGITQPLLYAILSVEVPTYRHGASVGLRNTVVRLASIVTPAVMGVIAEAVSIEASFYAIGAAFLLATMVLAFFSKRYLKKP